jgi:hypothetical protein
MSLDMAASPLIGCSYQTRQQEYDRDTWRMYERIQSARASQEQSMSFVEDTAQSVNPNDILDDCDYDLDQPSAESDDESEGIFELDF